MGIYWISVNEWDIDFSVGGYDTYNIMYYMYEIHKIEIFFYII